VTFSRGAARQSLAIFSALTTDVMIDNAMTTG